MQNFSDRSSFSGLVTTLEGIYTIAALLSPLCQILEHGNLSAFSWVRQRAFCSELCFNNRSATDGLVRPDVSFAEDIIYVEVQGFSEKERPKNKDITTQSRAKDDGLTAQRTS